jgi:hypothetical protein
MKGVPCTRVPLAAGGIIVMGTQGSSLLTCLERGIRLNA